MKLGLILSNDWELYGDGSGDYFKVQHRPLLEMLSAVRQHGAKITVMAEVAQQWAYEELAPAHPWARDIAQSFEEALKETIRQGSDVQLHLHPQWLDARWENGRWTLDYSKWAFSSLSYPRQCSVLRRGKEYLESLLTPLRRDYECIAFRAGAYAIEPSRSAVAALRATGFCCDSTVTKGMTNPARYDYRDAHSHAAPWWISSQSVKHDGPPNGLLEIPIYSASILESPILRRLLGFTYTRWPSARDKRWQAARNRYLLAQYPLERRPHFPAEQRQQRNLGRYLKAALRTTPVQLDYDNLPPMVFVDLMEKVFSNKQLRRWCEALEEHAGEQFVLPIMASGHVKTMHNCDNLRRILDEVNGRLAGRVVFWNTLDAVRAMQAWLLPASPAAGSWLNILSTVGEPSTGALGCGHLS